MTTSIAALGQNAPQFRFVERAGPYTVGLKVVEQYDYSRVYRYTTDLLGKPSQAERARPMQTLIWYPAQPSNAKFMTVGDYGNFWKSEIDFGKSSMPGAALEWLSGLKTTLAITLRAIPDAPMASGRFPVVIYAPSFSSIPTPWENADLCEYLASHGYLVVASPNMGAKSRKMTPDLAGVNTQARDISFLIGYAQTLADADISQVAVVGFSWGGIANLFAAARDSRIAALVALDGSMRYFPELVREAGDVHPDQLAIPLLYFEQGDFSIEDQDRLAVKHERHEYNVLNLWAHGDLMIVRMLGLTHKEFSAMYQRNERTWRDFYDPKMPTYQKSDYGREDGAVGYGWMARYTLGFLDAHVKHAESAMRFLMNAPSQNGVPKHVMSVDYHPGVGVAPSFEGFREQIGRKGFDQAETIYETMRKEKPDFQLDERDVNSWAEDLIDSEYLQEAIALLMLNVHIHPDSIDAYADLGDAYRNSGQKQLAIDNYQKSLERDPDREVKSRLNELQGSRVVSH